MSKPYSREQVKSLLGPAGLSLFWFEPPNWNAAEIKYEGAKALMNASVLSGMLDAWPDDHPFRADVEAARKSEVQIAQAVAALISVNNPQPQAA